MKECEVEKVKDLLCLDIIIKLLVESKKEGFRFVERLINDYKTGTNTFDQQAEGLYCVYDSLGEVVAIGGINVAPFAKKTKIGRLRRFYVSKKHRRFGIGSQLLKRIISESKKHFQVLVLHTDTDQPDSFYTYHGFSRGNLAPNSTHYLHL